MTSTQASAKKKVLSSQKNFFFKTIQNLRCSGKLLNIVSVFSGNSLEGLWKAIHINFVNMVDKTQLPGVVYDRNQVLLLETENRVQFLYRYWSWNFFIFPRPKLFLFNKLQIFYIFSHVFTTFCENINFYEFINKPQSSKNNLQTFIIWKQILFYGSFSDGKNTPYYRWLDTLFAMWFIFILVTVSADTFGQYCKALEILLGWI